jgi:N-acetyl-gamma-glutamyl-phosphate reductase common form
MAESKIKIGIFGGSGYGGSELLRILLFHPNAEVVFVTGNEHAGKSVSSVHRNLNSLTELCFISMPDDLSILEEIDVAFFGLPHGQALELVPRLPDDIKVIDLSGDFRLADPETFERYYKKPHAGQLQHKFVYGLTETNREAIAAAEYISNPGCFATATALALSPLLSEGLVMGKLIVDAKTGSSGSGAKPAANTHHPQRMNSFYAYKPFTHQHVPEIEQHLRSIGPFTAPLVFMSHSLPVSRGIFASCYAELNEEMTTTDLAKVFTSFYQDSFFVRIVDGSPDINWVKNTNFCDIAVNVSGRNAVVLSAIDNLVKGAAGQAIQNMNLMFGLDEKTGLMFTGSNP